MHILISTKYIQKISFMIKSSISVCKFESTDEKHWDDFVFRSKNGTFMHTRKFINYHGDKFEDASLLVYKNSKLIAVLPANKSNGTVFSHQGLSYGGLVLKPFVKLSDVLAAFHAILTYYDDMGYEEIYVKHTPSLHHKTPSDEMLYAFFLTNAVLYRRDAAICLQPKDYKPNENRRRKIKSANSHNLTIRESQDMTGFWNDVLIPNLQIKHNGKPVHSLEEIQFLKDTFPKNIKQYNVYLGDEILGGTTLFNSDTTALAQYISATDRGKSLDALSPLFEHLITTVCKDYRFFSFGHSNESNGRVLNNSLSYWKESFGGSSLIHDFYKIKIANHRALESFLS